MSFVEVATVFRAGRPESRHSAAAAVVDAEGRLLASLGDPHLATFPRSSVKPFQALPLIETGAADAFGLSEAALALACASHRGEPFHLQLVGEWLERIGATADDLACGAEPPLDRASDLDLARHRREPTRMHHNCSGKHTGMLTICRHCDWARAGYSSREHPLQARIFATLGEIIGRPAESIASATDGCTLPAPFLTLAEMAQACARFAGGVAGDEARRLAMRRLLAAMAAHPEMVSGTGQPTVLVNRATAGRVLIKTGAEGFLAVWLPARRIGMAIKVADGNGRAAVPLLVEILRALDLVGRSELEALEPVRHPPVKDSVGAVVGEIRANAESMQRG